VRRARAAVEAVRAGPLGLIGSADVDTQTRPPLANEPRHEARRPVQSDALPVPTDALPDRLLLRVDGVGSFLVLRRASVTIGPVGSSRSPDVALAADPRLAPITIARVDDDYFLRADRGAPTVNDRPLFRPHDGDGTGGAGGGAATAAARLLADGDRVALAPRCRLAFGLPTPASTSAVLDLGGACLATAGTGDVRRGS
jgi:hypothetical protein